MKFLLPFLRFILHLGYFGPLVMGILESSFLILPFGNDMVVVWLVARHRHGVPWYVLSAATGSTIGVLILASVAQKLGEEGLTKIAGETRYRKLRDRIGNRAGTAVAIAAVAPPPFPFNTVIAAVAAIGYPKWRILVANFFARLVRFSVLGVLALRFGPSVLQIARSEPFQWSMFVFIMLCFVASAYSLWHWWRKTRRQQVRRAA